jgi:hypothetical protein
MTTPITPEHVAALLAARTRGHWLVVSDELQQLSVYSDCEPSPLLIADTLTEGDAALIAAAPDIARAYVEQTFELERLYEEIAARASYPSLREERDALRAEVAALRAAAHQRYAIGAEPMSEDLNSGAPIIGNRLKLK